MDTKTYQFTVIFEQDEDGVFIATVPSLQGCNSFGDTLEEAEKNIKEAIAGFLETLQEVGDPIPEPDEAASFSLSKPLQISLSA